MGTSRLTFEPAQVTRIEQRGDSLKNGAIFGALYGTAGAVASISSCGGCGLGIAQGLAGVAVSTAIRYGY